MKTMMILILTFLVCTLTFPVYPQEACKVLVEGIAEEYEGGCRRGYAHGQGTARGVDHYEGRFRNGLPHGMGRYTWENGNIYEGRWKEGMRHGKGTYTFGKDGEMHTISGIWRDDEFVGQEKTQAYSLGHMMNVERYRIRRTGDGNMILMSVHEYGRVHPSPRNLIMHINSGSSITVGQSVGYENVAFPAEVKITYEMHDKLQLGTMMRVHFEVTINEPGVWELRFFH